MNRMKKWAILFWLTMSISNVIFARSAQKEFTSSALKALGAPNNPKVEVAWNRYYDWQEIGSICKRLQQAHPGLVRLSAIGKSYQGKEIFLLTVSNLKQEPDRKPAMYIDGNIHANEIQGAEVALYTAWYLVESYGTIDWITELLDHKTFYIVPTINPDARDHFIHQANSPHSPRSGLVPRDDDGDGLLDEDGPDDLDGDGHIVMMRKRDPNGRWRPDPDDPRIMIRAKPDEAGEYTLLGSEGFDNDGDGLVNEDGPGYYDPNRNWAWHWQPSYIQHGADQYPFSIPENRAVADFVMAHPNIGAAQSYHNSGGMILRGPGAPQDDSTFNRQDLEVYDFLGNLGAEMLPGYRYLVVGKDMYPAYGGELDWFYGARGIFTFTNELWLSQDMFRRKPEGEDDWFGSRKETYRFDKLLLFGEGIVPWSKFQHPQYGEVEIGGVKKAWTRTAPSFLLEEMCHRNMAFTLFHAYHLPYLSVDSTHVQEIIGGLKQIDVIIKNSRVLPTRSAHELKYRITPPDYVTFRSEKARVVAGFVVENPYLNQVQEQKFQPARIAVSAIEGMAAVHLRWIVAGNPPFELAIASQKGGQVSFKIER